MQLSVDFNLSKANSLHNLGQRAQTKLGAYNFVYLWV